MGMFAVKNDNGEWLGWEVYKDDPEFICGGGSVWTDLEKAKFYAKANGGHVVELVEAPVKYISRYRYKGKPVEDLEKADWYLKRLISEMEDEK